MGKMVKRTNLQRKLIRMGYPREMIPLRQLHPGFPRYTYLLGASENWRSQRDLANLMWMPIRPVAKQMIHNGRKP